LARSPFLHAAVQANLEKLNTDPPEEPDIVEAVKDLPEPYNHLLGNALALDQVIQSVRVRRMKDLALNALDSSVNPEEQLNSGMRLIALFEGTPFPQPPEISRGGETDTI
jgi:hypothetical protein